MDSVVSRSNLGNETSEVKNRNKDHFLLCLLEPTDFTAIQPAFQLEGLYFNLNIGLVAYDQVKRRKVKHLALTIKTHIVFYSRSPQQARLNKYQCFTQVITFLSRA